MTLGTANSQPRLSSTQRPQSRHNSRPNTPLRRASRSAINLDAINEGFPLDCVEPRMAELLDSMADLEENLHHLQMLHESLSSFSENFASFLYGLNMNAYCVEFSEAPAVPTSFKRAAKQEEGLGVSTVSGFGQHWKTDYDIETTFMTNEASFVNEPPKAVTPTPKVPQSRGVPRGGNIRGSRGRGGVNSRSASTRGRGYR